MRKELIVAMALQAAASLPTFAQGEALFSDQVVVPLPATQTHRGITGPMLELKDGSILFVYDACEATPLGRSGGLEARRSTDGGRTWGEPYLFEPAIGLNGTDCGGLLRLPNGKILVAETILNGPEYYGDPRHSDEHTYARLSADEAQTWSYPLCATLMFGACYIQNDGLRQLSTGRIIMPVTTGAPDNNWVSTCVYSDNDGISWWPSKNYVAIAGSFETGEPHVAELADGRLTMLVRTDLGYMARSYSTDHGESWSPAELVKDLPASIPSPSDLVRLPTTGDLLCLWCNNPHGPKLLAGEDQPTVQVGQLQCKLGYVRAPLSSAISHDGGQTWGQVRDLTHDPPGVDGDYGYPCVCFLDQGKTVLVNYHALDGIHVARINVDWFYGE